MSKYEFAFEQKRHIEKVRVTLLHISLLMFGIACFVMLIGLRLPSESGWVSMLAASLSMVLGVSYFHPLVSLKRVSAASGDDISQIVTAMDKLHTTFSVGTYTVLGFNGLTLIAIFSLLV